ncbi:MAG: hypothetical protein ACP5VR_02700 [Acidimicrobiales bacterium]
MTWPSTNPGPGAGKGGDVTGPCATWPVGFAAVPGRELAVGEPPGGEVAVGELIGTVVVEDAAAEAVPRAVTGAVVLRSTGVAATGPALATVVAAPAATLGCPFLAVALSLPVGALWAAVPQEQRATPARAAHAHSATARTCDAKPANYRPRTRGPRS